MSVSTVPHGVRPDHEMPSPDPISAAVDMQDVGKTQGAEWAIGRQPLCQLCPDRWADLPKWRFGRSTFGTGFRLAAVQRCLRPLNAPTVSTARTPDRGAPGIGNE